MRYKVQANECHLKIETLNEHQLKQVAQQAFSLLTSILHPSSHSGATLSNHTNSSKTIL